MGLGGARKNRWVKTQLLTLTSHNNKRSTKRSTKREPVSIIDMIAQHLNKKKEKKGE